jgi:hypothetical protein
MRFHFLLGAFLLAAASLRAEDPPAMPNILAKPDAFQTLVNPNCSHCIDESKRREKDLRAGDPALCWTRGKYDGGAIPIRFFLNTYRVISDTYGVFVYDPDAGFARAFEPSLDFRFYGWHKGVMAMQHKDGTIYSCLSGRAIAGPKKGTELKWIPTIVSEWGWWLKQYPGTVAYHMFDKYMATELPANPSEDSLKSRTKLDGRLAANERVLGVWDGKKARAFVLNHYLPEDKNVVTVLCGAEKEIHQFLIYGETKTAAAYRQSARSPKGEQEVVSVSEHDLRPEWKSAPFVDSKTKSHWDISGRCVEGQLKGWTLEPLDAVTCKWFAWVAEYPDTEILGTMNDR